MDRVPPVDLNRRLSLIQPNNHMKNRKLQLLGSLCACVLTAGSALAKDKPVTLQECPAPVQAVIRQYQEKGTLEEIGLDEKKKSGGPAVYEAKFTLAGGRRIELHISPNGTILEVEEKKRKN